MDKTEVLSENTNMRFIIECNELDLSGESKAVVELTHFEELTAFSARLNQPVFLCRPDGYACVFTEDCILVVKLGDDHGESD